MVQYLGNKIKSELTMDQPYSHPAPQTRNQINHACVQPTESTEVVVVVVKLQSDRLTITHTRTCICTQLRQVGEVGRMRTHEHTRIICHYSWCEGGCPPSESSEQRREQKHHHHHGDYFNHPPIHSHRQPTR